ncbi:MAG: Spy/CpxP family protein refolding chaperone [Acidobacteriota bacterium]
MYPGFIPHWKRGRCGDRGVAVGIGFAECADQGRGWEFHAAPEDAEDGFGFGSAFGGGGGFGVRRPLRFLVYKLQLEEAQVAELVRILDEIKTERAQAAVDHRRAISSFADAIEGEVFDEPKAKAGASLRLQSAERLQAAVVATLGRLHKLLDPQQRSRLAYLIHTATLSI